jgi:hypothetical protein
MDHSATVRQVPAGGLSSCPGVASVGKQRNARLFQPTHGVVCFF